MRRSFEAEGVQTHFSEPSAMSSQMVCSFARISDWRRESFALRSALSKVTTMYSIFREGLVGLRQRGHGRKASYLVSPEQLVAAAILEAVPYVQELGDAMCPDVVCVLFCIIPGEGGAERQEAHARRGSITK